MSNANVKETPKKVYKSCNVSSKTCRLCRSVGDVKYLKNLYNKANVGLLSMVEALYGGKLPCQDELPRLVCRPCERRLNNFKSFKTLVCASQTAFFRTKRCIDISPSAPTSNLKRGKINVTNIATRGCRGLSFGGSDTSLSTETFPPQVKSILQNNIFSVKLVWQVCCQKHTSENLTICARLFDIACICIFNPLWRKRRC